MPSEHRYVRLGEGVFVEVTFDPDRYTIDRYDAWDGLQLVFDGPDGTARLTCEPVAVEER
ncbi:hypothetical protein [Halorubellus litoreus]|uniref:Uncharacterized protein n=1 Tax=Halorubellus litoreus TaxID=755308 RepID=A0ABD5VFU1_9EURY